MEQTASPKYRAFISYSHRDAAFGQKLHRQLEAFALPRRLAGQTTPMGPAPKRLRPIFLDREELAAADDLGAEVERALADSACLVVICSPAAASSKWVDREIETFRALNPDRPILAALAHGEPALAIPTGLRHSGTEPLAADFRSNGDGRRLAILKLVAGMTGLGLDDLVRRETQRRMQRAALTAIAATIAALSIGASVALAFNARTAAAIEGEHDRQLGLIDQYGRLRDKGQLALAGSLSSPLVRDFAAQELRGLPIFLLQERARILYELGEYDMQQNDQTAAQLKFSEAARTNLALANTGCDEPECVFLRAQAQWVLGSDSLVRRRSTQAKAFLLRARTLAQRAVASEPRNTRYQLFLANTEVLLCRLTQQSNLTEAEAHCAAALKATTIADKYNHPDISLSANVAIIQDRLAAIRSGHPSLELEMDAASIGRRDTAG